VVDHHMKFEPEPKLKVFGCKNW